MPWSIACLPSLNVLVGCSRFYGTLKEFFSLSHKLVSYAHTTSFKDKTSESRVQGWATCAIFCFLRTLPWDPRSACKQNAKLMYRSARWLYLPFLFLNSLKDKSNRSTMETASETFVSSKVIGKPEFHLWQTCCLIHVCEVPFINISTQGLYVTQSCKFLAYLWLKIQVGLHVKFIFQFYHLVWFNWMILTALCRFPCLSSQFFRAE